MLTCEYLLFVWLIRVSCQNLTDIIKKHKPYERSWPIPSASILPAAVRHSHRRLPEKHHWHLFILWRAGFNAQHQPYPFMNNRHVCMVFIRYLPKNWSTKQQRGRDRRKHSVQTNSNQPIRHVLWPKISRKEDTITTLLLGYFCCWL